MTGIVIVTTAIQEVDVKGMVFTRHSCMKQVLPSFLQPGGLPGVPLAELQLAQSRDRHPVLCRSVTDLETMSI